MCSMYYALFHSYLNYGLNVWSLADKTILKKIKVVQNNAIRAIAGLKRHESCSKHYKELEIIKLKDTIFMNKIKFIWDYESNSFRTQKSARIIFSRISNVLELSLFVRFVFSFFFTFFCFTVFWNVFESFFLNFCFVSSFSVFSKKF